MKQQKQKQKPNPNSYTSVGKGEYQLHVLIQSTSGLSLVSDSSIDPKIAVHAFGQTEYTKAKSNVGVEQTFWGQHIYFNTQFSSIKVIQNQRLLIQVYDYNRLSFDALVGNYEIDIQRIYSQQNHTIKHTWLALSNIQKDFSQITGYVKISVSLVGENDQNVQLDVQPISSITKEKKVLVPPHIERKNYQIIVDVIQGRNIKPADGQTVDSYLGVQFGQIYQNSQTITKNCNPKYDTRIYLPLSLPAVIQNIAFRLNDFNFLQKVQVLGSYYLNISQLIKKYEAHEPKILGNRFIPNCSFEEKLPYQDFQWVNFYGPQIETSREDPKNIQQFFPQLAPYYVGSLLMKVSINQNSQPQRKKQIITLKQKDKYALINPPLYFKITAKITAALNVLQKNRKYKVCISVGAEQIQTDYSKAKNGFCFWNEQRSFVITITPFQTIPDIFIYLVDEKGQKISYSRFKPKEGIILEDMWFKMTPDLAKINIQNEQAGYLKVGIELTPSKSKEKPKVRKLDSSLQNAYKFNKKSGRLVIDLLCGQSLIPLDEDGSIDPYFSFNFLQFQVISSLKNDTLNPVYFQRLIIQTDILDEQGCPPIIVNAWDKDKFSNQFLGTTFIDIGEAIKNKSLVYGPNKNPQPFWYQMTQNGIITGKFLATFQLLPNFSLYINPQLSLPKKTYEISLVIMGLRGLKNSNVISVKQPFIEFDFASLDVYNNKKLKQEKNNKLIATQPKQKGRSVNIISVIPAKVILPDNYKYWPALSAKVKDNVLGSFYQPILGYFSIDLQNAYIMTQKIRAKLKQKNKVLMMSKSQIISKPQKLANINDNLIMSIRNFIMKSLNYNWKILTPSIYKDLNLIRNFPQKKINQDFIVIFPNYQKLKMGKISQNSKENKQEKYKYVQKYKQIILKNQQYMQIGFDDIQTRQLGIAKRNKHYRFVLHQPYEKYFQRVNGFKLGIMDETPIKIGRIFPSNDLVSNFIRKVSKEESISGIYKGQLLISEYKQNHDQQYIQFRKQSTNLLNILMRKSKIHMYLYVIQAANLERKDLTSNSDPYLVVKGGKQTLQFKKQYFTDEPNPQFLKKIHMVLNFPEDSMLDIQIWDYDPILADELIGSVTIDIENRIQSKIADAICNIPIQTHNLTHFSSKRQKGLIRFWIDLVPVQNISLYRQFEISNKSKTNFEVRVIVWSCTQMPNNDIQDMSDLYIQCQFNNQSQQTDVNYRSSSGDGYFNWRMVFPVQLPIKNPLLTFKVFDQDIVTSNDYLASATFSIGEKLQQAFETNSSVILFLGTEDLAKQSQVPGSKKHIINGQQLYDRFYIQTQNRAEAPPNRINKQGKIQISVQILSEEDVKKNPVGKGRDQPNQHPYLPNPSGRFSLSMNPLTMLSQIFGPKVKRQACLAICLFISLYIILSFGLSFSGSLVGALISR